MYKSQRIQLRFQVEINVSKLIKVVENHEEIIITVTGLEQDFLQMQWEEG